MARRKKMDDEQMLLLAQEYYAEKCNGNSTLLKASKIGEYIRSKGYDIQDFLVRRNKKISAFIKEVQKENEFAKLTLISVFQDMDVDEFIRKNSGHDALRKALIERQNYYMNLANTATIIFEENKKLKKKVENLEEDISLLEQELESTASSKKETLSGFHEAKRRVRVLQDLVETYVYPEIANELLVQRGIIKKTEGVVDPKVVDENLVKPSDDVRKIESKLIKGLFDAL